MGSDDDVANCNGARLFQSTLPVWAATTISSHKLRLIIHFNPRCPCGQRHTIGLPSQRAIKKISIHAARVGSDCKLVHAFVAHNISIHAARVGSDQKFLWIMTAGKIFQSTLPVWAATYAAPSFSTYSAISIHAARVGSDLALNVNQCAD